MWLWLLLLLLLSPPLSLLLPLLLSVSLLLSLLLSLVALKLGGDGAYAGVLLVPKNGAYPSLGRVFGEATKE